MSQKNKTDTIVDVIKNAEKQGLAEYAAQVEKENSSLHETIDRLLSKIQEYENEIINLRRILEDNGESGLLAPPTDEELIADLQLRRLTEKAKLGELNLEEIKKYDLLVKNKRLAQGKSTSNVDQQAKLPQLPNSKLIEIAGKRRKEDR